MQTPTVDNDIYRRKGHAWWDDSVGEFSSIRFFVNPVRFGYFQRILAQERGADTSGLTLLDVGCGGGILAEDFARAGLRVTGVDPAPESVRVAQAHAAAGGLSIEYRTGSGEALAFTAAAFDLVACCDVLEHVADIDRVVAEIARVLKPGGLFFFDTINRTFESKVAMIWIMQEWRATAFVPPNSHVWERFIKPAELRAVLTRHGLAQRGLRGITIRSNPVSAWLNFRRRAKGQMTFEELGRRLAFCEGDDLHTSYMGYAARAATA
jgi:2-polyprenyl-6-hydroxyphenyl methylase / 3-demethylubiquinone-9 3-methyltransferase